MSSRTPPCPGNLSHLPWRRVKGLAQAKLLLALFLAVVSDRLSGWGRGGSAWKTVEKRCLNTTSLGTSGEMAATEPMHGQEAERRWAWGWVWVILSNKGKKFGLGGGGDVGGLFQKA